MIQLQQNENLIAVFRKHPFYIIMKIVSLVILALPTYFIFAPVAEFFGIDINSFMSEARYLVFFVYLLFLCALWVMGFTSWTNYYLDMWVLTDKSLIDIEQKGLFMRDISSMRLDRIQDIKVEVHGMLDAFLGTGTVHVQTAGNDKEFIISQVKDPEKVKEFIASAYHNQAEEIKTVKIAGGELAGNLPK